MSPIKLTPTYKRALDIGLSLFGLALGYLADPSVAIISAPLGGAVGAIISEVIANVNSTGNVDPQAIALQALQNPAVQAEVQRLLDSKSTSTSPS